MARGSEAKEKITNQILAQFPGSFKYDKEIRIPIMENGEEIQIKVTLTAAKTNVTVGGDTALPGNWVPGGGFEEIKELVNSPTLAPMPNIEPTQEEKDAVAKLLASFNL